MKLRELSNAELWTLEAILGKVTCDGSADLVYDRIRGLCENRQEDSPFCLCPKCSEEFYDYFKLDYLCKQED